MNGANSLSKIAFVVCICVIVGIAIVFAVLYGLYGIYKKKNINFGHEDKSIEEDLKKNYGKRIGYKEENRSSSEGFVDVKPLEGDLPPLFVYTEGGSDVSSKILNDNSIQPLPDLVPSDLTVHKTFMSCILSKRKNQKKTNLIFNIIFTLLYVVTIAVIAFSVVYRVKKQQVFFGNTAVMTIQTGSMETVNENNHYVHDNNLLDDKYRIEQYSLIGITKVKSEDDVHLGDIMAYIDNEGKTIVHRVVEINTNDKNETEYKLQGDANNVSSYYESHLTFDKFIGKYNGFQSFGLGVVITYCQSNIGLISLFAAVMFLLSYNICEEKVDKAYEKRREVIATKLDKDILGAI